MYRYVYSESRCKQTEKSKRLPLTEDSSSEANEERHVVTWTGKDDFKTYQLSGETCLLELWSGKIQEHTL